MGTIWIPGAERLGDGSIGGAMDTPNLPPRSTWHSTESGAGDAAFSAVANYLIKIGAEPHVLYDPTTDRLGQFGPLNASARALRNDGSTRTNRTGKVNVQIEVLARAATPFTGYWKPGPNFRALMAALRSWGIPDRFPLPLAAQYGAGTRTRGVWLGEAGHYGHCNVPGNDHWDPGAISPAALFAAAPTGAKPEPKPAGTYTVKAGDTLSAIGRTLGVDWKKLAELNGLKSPYPLSVGQVLKTSVAKPAPTYEPFPGAAWFVRGRKSPIVLAMRKRLIAEGCNRYRSSVDPDVIGQGDIDSYEAWQRKCGHTGTAAEWPPGPSTWSKLRVPNV